MTTATASTFFAILALLCLLGTAMGIALLVIDRFRPSSPAAAWISDVSRIAIWLAWIVAMGTTLGSLYYSQIAEYVPCELCWFQRIAMYPLALILLIAALRNDRWIWVYAVPLSAIGAAISVYHTQLQAFPEQATFCSTTVPCTTRYVWQFGFVSLPFMALAAFSFIMVMLLLARTTSAAARNPDSRSANSTSQAGN
ncbi:MAG: disulfide oxidoreductase [Actinomycetes bacterium]